MARLLAEVQYETRVANGKITVLFQTQEQGDHSGTSQTSSLVSKEFNIKA